MTDTDTNTEVLIKKTSIFFNTGLPKKGWFQACTMCQIVTSKLHHCKTVSYPRTAISPPIRKKIFSYLCHVCSKNLSNKTFYDEYDDICNELIYANESTLTTS